MNDTYDRNIDKALNMLEMKNDYGIIIINNLFKS